VGPKAYKKPHEAPPQRPFYCIFFLSFLLFKQRSARMKKSFLPKVFIFDFYTAFCLRTLEVSLLKQTKAAPPE